MKSENLSKLQKIVAFIEAEGVSAKITRFDDCLHNYVKVGLELTIPRGIRKEK